MQMNRFDMGDRSLVVEDDMKPAVGIVPVITVGKAHNVFQIISRTGEAIFRFCGIYGRQVDGGRGDGVIHPVVFCFRRIERGEIFLTALNRRAISVIFTDDISCFIVESSFYCVGYRFFTGIGQNKIKVVTGFAGGQFLFPFQGSV